MQIVVHAVRVLLPDAVEGFVVVYAAITEADKKSRIHFLTGTVVLSGGLFAVMVLLTLW